ncbi:MAG: hypothetical protein ACOY82_05045 [Pseudomonadota bacterium]
MHRIRRFVAVAAIALLAPLGTASAVNTATADLIAVDKSVTTGWLEARVEFYPPPDAKNNAGTPKIIPAQLLFARPNQFRLAMYPGAKNEYRAAASGGVASWRDMGTGIGGQGKYDSIVDPFTRAMLGVAGAISRYAPSKEVAVDPNTPLRGTKSTVRSYGSSVISSKSWFYNDQPVGFEFLLSDNSRVFVSVLTFKPNVPTKPGDFAL